MISYLIYQGTNWGNPRFPLGAVYTGQVRQTPVSPNIYKNFERRIRQHASMDGYDGFKYEIVELGFYPESLQSRRLRAIRRAVDEEKWISGVAENLRVNKISPLLQLNTAFMNDALMALNGKNQKHEDRVRSGRASAAAWAGTPQHKEWSIRGGRIGGKMGNREGKVRSGKLFHIKYPELAAANASAGGKRSCLLHPENTATAGRLGGFSRAAKWTGTPEGHEWSVRAGKASAHSRWHLGRGIVDSNCSLCTKKVI